MEAGDLLWWSLKGAAERVIMMTVFNCLVLDFALALCRHFLCIMFCISIIFPASPSIVWTHSLVTEYILWIMSLLHIRVTENWKEKAAAQYVALLAFRLRPMTVTVMWAPNWSTVHQALKVRPMTAMMTRSQRSEEGQELAKTTWRVSLTRRFAGKTCPVCCFSYCS